MGRGHEVVLVVPGPRAADERLATGIRRTTVAAPRLPGTGGYRAVDPWRIQRLLERLRPDAIEVSDRLTLRGLGTWASRRGVVSVVMSHERLDRLLTQFLLPEPRPGGWPTGRTPGWRPTTTPSCARPRSPAPSSSGSARATWRRSRSGSTSTTFSPGAPRRGTAHVVGRSGRRPARALRTALTGEAPRAQRRHRGRSARRRAPGAARRRRGRTAAGSPGAPVGRPTGDVPRLRAVTARRLARLLASADVSLAPGPARDVRAVGAGVAGQRHAGGRLGVVGAPGDRRPVGGRRAATRRTPSPSG